MKNISCEKALKQQTSFLLSFLALAKMSSEGKLVKMEKDYSGEVSALLAELGSLVAVK
jgi:hypothetical protein